MNETTDDHLDESTILDIRKHHGNNVKYMVPLRVKAFFLRLNICPDMIVEMGWWEETLLLIPAINAQSIPMKKQSKVPLENLMPSNKIDASNQATRSLKIVCTPAQHNSGRSFLKQNQTLCATWLIEWKMPHGKPFTCFFGG